MNFVKFGKLTNRELKSVLKEVASFRDNAGTAGLYSEKTNEKIDLSFRNSLIVFPKLDVAPHTYNILQSVIIEQCLDLDYDFTKISEIQYARYEEGGLFKWHSDVISKPTDLELRGFTFTMNLSNPKDYEGGELLLKHNGKEYQLDKEPGSYVIFPSFLLHQASIVTKGVRESMVVWTHVPLWDQQRLEKEYRNLYGKPA